MANIGFKPWSLRESTQGAQVTRNLQQRENILRQEGQENDRATQLQNTQWLNKIARDVIQNPASARGAVEQGIQMRIFDPQSPTIQNIDYGNTNQIVKDFTELEAKTRPYLPKAEDTRTKEMKNWEYGQQPGNERFMASQGGAGYSANSEIIGNYVIQSDNKGGVRVTDLNGTPVTGPEATKAIMGAREAKKQRSIDIKVEGSRLEIANKNRIARSEAAYDKVESLRENNRNLRQAANAIDDGANTGYIANIFPSFKKSTIELENAANRLGLDVVGAVTFGALSAGELKMAMATAIPQDMDEPALKQWLLDRISAQEKLIGYFNEYAGYMSTAGNTIAKWNEKVESMGKYKENPVDTPPGGFTDNETYEQRKARVLGQ